MFDLAGSDPTKIHIGDWVTYDAGEWTEGERNSIQVGVLAHDTVEQNLKGVADGSPNSNFQFGGFASSRNEGSRVNYNMSEYDYATMYTGNDPSGGSPLSGWRLFDVDKTNKEIVLISAAAPEIYRHNYVDDSSENGYISEYILTGNVNSDWSESENATS